MNSYKNPSLDLEKRSFYSINSQEFKLVMKELHEEFSVDTNQKRYCKECHWTFARAGNKFHKSCTKVSAFTILGNINFI